LWYGGIVTVVIASVSAVIGYLAGGIHGVVSAILAAVMTALFLGLTAGSIMIASRVTRNSPSSSAYFGVIVVVWLLKFVLFIVAIIVLRQQPWLDGRVFIVVLIISVIGSLVTDAVAMLRSRVPYVGDIELPGAPPSGDTV
jgi:glucan phosphoethanolaminetransferase (alkaline phosphatase superfamily)